MSTSNTLSFSAVKMPPLSEPITKAYRTLLDGTGPGSEMRGWMTWPAKYLKSEEYARLKETAKKIRENFKHVVVIGIGGSYLGAEALIKAYHGSNYNMTSETKVHFIASMSSLEWKMLSTVLSKESFCIIYISKSGTTLEPATALRYFYDLHLEYHTTAPTVYAITDASKGTARKLANDYKWDSFIIPDDIGGRYSVFTAVGMLPVAVAGIDTDKILESAAEALKICMSSVDNIAVQYANWRYQQYLNGCTVEFMAVNNPELAALAEWWKQLFAESEGKNYSGLFTAKGVFSMDLHSLGQYLQQGERSLICETFFTKKEHCYEDGLIEIVVPSSILEDNLNYLEGRNLNDLNSAAMEGSFIAHSSDKDGKIPNPCSEFKCGGTIYDVAYYMAIMEFACPISAYAIGANPFDQPGVEDYKTEVKAILGNTNS